MIRIPETRWTYGLTIERYGRSICVTVTQRNGWLRFLQWPRLAYVRPEPSPTLAKLSEELAKAHEDMLMHASVWNLLTIIGSPPPRVVGLRGTPWNS